MMTGNVLFAVLVCGAAFCQSPEFEVASIKPSAQVIDRVNVGVHVDGAQVRCTYLSLKDYIRMAYNVKDHQIVGPDWMASDRFDIAAKVPEGGRDKIREMLQSLLKDRFHIKFHNDTKEFPVYALVVGKGGPKMKESPVDPEEPAPDEGRGSVNVTASGGRGGVVVNMGHGSFFNFSDNKLIGKKLTMAQFAATLERFMDRPVIDLTGLAPSYDFTLDFTPEDYRAMQIRSAIAAGVVLPPQAMKLLEENSGDSLFSAIAALGLKLDTRKAPIEVLVVDEILKTPTEN
jgi:uncharacterized protein (TIGR03435 family)